MNQSHKIQTVLAAWMITVLLLWLVLIGGSIYLVEQLLNGFAGEEPRFRP